MFEGEAVGAVGVGRSAGSLKHAQVASLQAMTHWSRILPCCLGVMLQH
jgi:hypothetical protein